MTMDRTRFILNIAFTAVSKRAVQAKAQTLADGIAEFIDGKSFNLPTPTSDEPSQGEQSKFVRLVNYLEEIAGEVGVSFDRTEIGDLMCKQRILRNAVPGLTRPSYEVVLSCRASVQTLLSALTKLLQGIASKKLANAPVKDGSDGKFDESRDAEKFVYLCLEAAIDLQELAETLPPPEYVDFGEGVEECIMTYQTRGHSASSVEVCERELSEELTNMAHRLRVEQWTIVLTVLPSSPAEANHLQVNIMGPTSAALDLMGVFRR
jgi:hypothetical protein